VTENQIHFLIGIAGLLIAASLLFWMVWP